MTGEMLTVFLILGVAVVLFVSDKLRLDVVAVLVLLALTLSGLLTPAQALAGFGEPLVVMIAALFVVGGALVQTGVADSFGAALGRLAGRGERRLVVAIMTMTGLLSALMSSTGTVAVMLPIVTALAWRRGISPSKLLIPTAFAALVGGMLTLIATPPNLIVSQVLEEAGRGPFGFFAFTPFGLAMLAVSILFMATVGIRLLPARAAATAPVATGAARREPLATVAARFGLPQRLAHLTLPADSELVGARLGELRWPERLGVQLLALERQGEAPGAGPAWRGARSGVPSRHMVGRVGPHTRFVAGDKLLLQGDEPALAELAVAAGGVLEAASEDSPITARAAVAEVLLPPRSNWIGASLASLGFRERFGLQVLALQRGPETVHASSGDTPLADLKLRFGDTLLVQGAPAALARLGAERHDALVLSEAGERAPAPRAAKAPLTLVILGAMLLVMTTGWLAPVVTVLLAVLALVLGGCISVEQSYRSIQWQSVVLIAGMLPLATALEQTGGVDYLADLIVNAFGGRAPLLLLAGVYLIVTTLGQFMSNTATAVLIAPVALQAALRLDLAPEPLLMMVALAAASSFCTPMATPVNTLVVGPGKYRFFDFVKIGVPLQALMLVVGLVLVPLLFPF